jgi:hypothetical protein
LEQASAVIAPVISVASVAPKAAGVSMRTAWHVEIVDASLVPRDWLTVNEKALEAFARSTKGAVAVAGVRFFSEQTMAVGG